MNYLDMRLDFFGFLLCFLCLACADAPRSRVSAPIGEPLPSLTATELARFQDGALSFRRIYTPEEGLGPRFNENACNACHTDPADGGTGEQLVLKSSRVDANATCDPLQVAGGPNLRRRVTEAARAVGAEAVPTPEVATHSGRFTTPFLFGMGLVDAIDVATLQALADPDDLDGDGISGRIGMDGSGNPARFGRKANTATLADFADEAFRMEMGLTTPRYPNEADAGDVPATGLQLSPAASEVDSATFAATVDFARFLAPPNRASSAQGEAAVAGEALFESLGCVSCHVPELTTGRHSSAAISEKAIGIYSDLLLHDMGPGLAGPCATGAAPQEYRTEPLMGLRYRRIFLHDGRAKRVRDAILMHGGEATPVRDRFASLDRVTQEWVLTFLGTL